MTSSARLAHGIIERLRAARIVPVLVIDDPADALPLVEALVAGGARAAEVTFRTAAGCEALKRVAAAAPALCTGAGTVLSTADAARAHDAGAQFVVAPGFNPRVVDYCIEHEIPVFPGVCTPSDIESALERGLTAVKFFPAEPIGGLAYLKSVCAPYAGIDFMPTGGINASNVASWLAFERVIACGGSWMAPREWIAARQFDRIRAECAQAMAGTGAAATAGAAKEALR